MDRIEAAAGPEAPVVSEVREQLLEPFIAATRTVLAELASAEVVVSAVYREELPDPTGTASAGEGRDDITAMVGITSASAGSLVLRFPPRTAEALARRILADVTDNPDESLVRDSVGEIANVVAGQAKAMLAGSAYQFTFSLPTVMAGASAHQLPASPDCLVVAFDSDQGSFLLHLYLDLSAFQGSV